jgi:hypothetical protein
MIDLDALGRSFFGILYDNRLLVAVGSVAALVLGLAIVRRAGWFAAARRHPGRSAIVGVAALIVGVPLAWYLASPIWLRTALVEPPPAIAVADPTSSPAPPAPSATPPADEPSATPDALPSTTPTPTPFEPAVVTTGSFHGSDDFHFGRGTATIIEVAPGRYHLRLEDFSVRNGPDLYVYLSPSAKGYDDGALELGRLKATDGAFGYDLPAGADPTAYASAIIWCKQFSHLFATAPFRDS